MLKEFKDAGFQIWDTGGNCTAFGRDIGEHAYLLVTDGEEAMHPTSETIDFTVGIYATEPSTSFNDFEGGNLFDGDTVAVIGIDAALEAVDRLLRKHKVALAAMEREAA